MADFGLMLLSERIDTFVDAVEKIGFTTNMLGKSKIELTHPKMHCYVDMNCHYLDPLKDNGESDEDVLRRVYFTKKYFPTTGCAMFRLPKNKILQAIKIFSDALADFVSTYNQSDMYYSLEMLFKEYYRKDPGIPSRITSDLIKLDPVGYSNREIDDDDTKHFDILAFQSVEISVVYGLWIRSYAKHCIV